MTTVQVDTDDTQDGFVRVDAIFSEGGDAVEDDSDLSLGERLRRARHRAGVTLDSASARTRLKRDYLEGLEHMDPRALPSRAYAVGYLRTYAQFLGLCPDSCVAQFKSEIEVDAGRDTPTAAIERREIKLPRGVFGVVLILTGVIAAAGWYGNYISTTEAYAGGNAPIDTLMTADAPLVSTEQLNRLRPDQVWSGLPSATSAQALVFEAASAVYFEVRDASGRILVSRDLKAGEVYRAPDEPGLKISASDAGAILVRMDGRPLGALGETGSPIDNASAAEFLIAALRSDNS